MNPKWVKALSVISETTNSQNKTGGKLLDMNLYNFFGFDTKSKDNKRESKQVDLYQTKKTARKTINKLKRLPMKWEKIFTNHTSDKGLLFKIYKEHNSKTIQLKIGQRI